MGIPVAFKWLSRKYPKIITPVIEENGTFHSSNPNGETDNLYLDMNNIVHPATHPEDKPPPATEEDAMVEVFKYIDRLMNMVRPRRLLYMAVDGVAPRAKMNQQRSRRFRAAQEAAAAEREVDEAKEPGTEPTVRFDSNCITPGTPFMKKLSDCLEYYIVDRLNSGQWGNLKVVLSDASVPGEGEHKIMEYIRTQRAHPRHDPNTKHVLYGLDADLIMLALLTHEPHFKVLREDVSMDDKNRKCNICKQPGHYADQCTGIVPQADKDVVPKEVAPKPYIFLHVNILREYLENEMKVTEKFDRERGFDDWVFLCFFVGNDFLPHIPSLDIREGAIDTLISIYKQNFTRMGGYLTENGSVDLSRVQILMEELGKQEDGIFRRRREGEEMRRKKRVERKQQRSSSSSYKPVDKIAQLSHVAVPVKNVKEFKSLHKTVVSSEQLKQNNLNAAAELKKSLKHKLDDSEEEPPSKVIIKEVEPEPEPIVVVDDDEDDADSVVSVAVEVKKVDSDDEPEDDVRLWEDGWRDRFYRTKFGIEVSDTQTRKQIVHSYVEGLCWVMKYYYQGCQSWKWYYPYHYSPFASDFDITDLVRDLKEVQFDKSDPFKPFEQLMGVLPAGSKSHIPEVYHPLMTEPDSEILDFYPVDFKIDLNGKKYAWQGVVLLPFIDESRLFAAMKTKEDLLTDEDHALNARGFDRLYVGSENTLYNIFKLVYSTNQTPKNQIKLDTNKSARMSGYFLPYAQSVKPDGKVKSPLTSVGMQDLYNVHVVSVHYFNNSTRATHTFNARLLSGVRLPERVLGSDDFLQRSEKRGSSASQHIRVEKTRPQYADHQHLQPQVNMYPQYSQQQYPQYSDQQYQQYSQQYPQLQYAQQPYPQMQYPQQQQYPVQYPQQYPQQQYQQYPQQPYPQQPQSQQQQLSFAQQAHQYTQQVMYDWQGNPVVQNKK